MESSTEEIVEVEQPKKRNKYSEIGAIKSLQTKHDVSINGNTIYLLTGNDDKNPRANDLGNGSHGKIDFLVNNHRYVKFYVDKFPTGK